MLVIDTLSLSLIAVLFPFIAAYVLPEDSAPSGALIAATIAVMLFMTCHFHMCIYFS